MTLYALERFKDCVEMKLTESDMLKIVGNYFDGKVCLSIKATPIKKPTHFILKLYPKPEKKK